MKLEKRTYSVCPECLIEIPAQVIVHNEAVIMLKECPTHGKFESILEKDSLYFFFMQSLNRGIYDAYVLEVTDQCNTKCKYCYYPTNRAAINPPVADIVALAEQNKHLGPFMLIGGEPTMREDLPEIISGVAQHGVPVLVTNGLKLADPFYLQTLIDAGLTANGYATISISLHPKTHQAEEEYNLKIKAIENTIGLGLIVESVIFVIDDMAEVDEAIAFADTYRGCFGAIRIKLASHIDQTGDFSHDLFASDVVNYLQDKAAAEGKHFGFNTDVPNIYSYCNTIYDGQNIIVLNMPDARTLDIPEIDCPPWTHLPDGRMVNIAYALIIGQRSPHKPVENPQPWTWQPAGAFRPNHEDLDEGIPIENSLILQSIAPELKPVVKGSLDQIRKTAYPEHLHIHLAPAAGYIIDRNAVHEIYGGTTDSALTEAINDLDNGIESHLLGYPDRRGLTKGQTIDAAVTTSGEVVTDLLQMKTKKEANEIAWAAEGIPDEVLAMAEKVAAAIRG